MFRVTLQVSQVAASNSMPVTIVPASRPTSPTRLQDCLKSLIAICDVMRSRLRNSLDVPRSNSVSGCHPLPASRILGPSTAACAYLRCSHLHELGGIGGPLPQRRPWCAAGGIHARPHDLQPA